MIEYRVFLMVQELVDWMMSHGFSRPEAIRLAQQYLQAALEKLSGVVS